MTWVSSIQALISSQEVASDVEGAETLLNRHKVSDLTKKNCTKCNNEIRDGKADITCITR